MVPPHSYLTTYSLYAKVFYQTIVCVNDYEIYVNMRAIKTAGKGQQQAHSKPSYMFH